MSLLFKINDKDIFKLIVTMEIEQYVKIAQS